MPNQLRFHLLGAEQRIESLIIAGDQTQCTASVDQVRRCAFRRHVSRLDLRGMLDLGVHPRVIMQILRHAQFDVTMELYASASSKATRKALKRLGKSLDG